MGSWAVLVCEAAMLQLPAPWTTLGLTTKLVA